MLDPVDEQIVRLLKRNGRLSQEQIGREVHLSRPAVHERMRRLEAQGVLRGYQALIDWGALGLPLAAFVWVRTAGTRCGETGAAIMRLSGPTATVEECHRVTGEWCLLLKGRVASPAALQALLDQIREVPGVQSTMTALVLSTLGEEAAEATRGALGVTGVSLAG